MSAVTQLLDAAVTGDPRAAADILPLVYDELRRLAAARLSAEPPGQTLNATALVHEAYLRLVGDQPDGWSGRGHFFAAAAEAMRRILVEAARRKGRVRHGGDRRRVGLDTVAVGSATGEDIVAVSEALDHLAAVNPEAAAVVKLRFFAGLTGKEAAAVLGVSPRKADGLWAYARAWLLERFASESG